MEKDTASKTKPSTIIRNFWFERMPELTIANQMAIETKTIETFEHILQVLFAFIIIRISAPKIDRVQRHETQPQLYALGNQMISIFIWKFIFWIIFRFTERRSFVENVVILDASLRHFRAEHKCIGNVRYVFNYLETAA